MRKLLNTVTGVALAAAPIAAALASEVAIPYEFQAGTPAVAAEVNDNFNAVAAAVNDNAARTTANSTAIANIEAQIGGGNGNCTGADEADVMVRVGPLCVDKYESSIWDAAGGTAAGAAQLDGESAYSGAGCEPNGAGCVGIYARSEAGVAPSTQVTWFQAQQACANVGKRLLTNAEWQMAAMGTPDPGENVDLAVGCNTLGGAKSLTGEAANCESATGVSDMVGNAWEWTADWVQGQNVTTKNGSDAGPGYGNDAMIGVSPANTQGAGSTNMPGALIRGGGYDPSGGLLAGVYALRADFAPSASLQVLGFRCAR